MKKLIIFTTAVILVATINTGAACAAEPGHWADPYIEDCLQNGIIAGTQDPENAVSYEDYLGMLENAGIPELPEAGHNGDLLKHEAAVLIAGYLETTYATKETDDILWGRIAYLSSAEAEKIAEHQHVDDSFVKPLMLLYSCGIIDADGCSTNEELKFGEACTLVSRLLDYEDLRGDTDALCIFYTMHCPCTLTGIDC